MELEGHKLLTVKEKTQIEIQKQIDHEFKLIGKLVLTPGLTLYEFDYEKMELKKSVIVQNKAIDFISKTPTQNKKTIYNHKAIYIQAHNNKAAVKKVNKIVSRLFNIQDYFTIQNKKIITNQNIIQNETR